MASALAVDGDCRLGRPMGALDSYPHRLTLRVGDQGWVRVRSTPTWSSGDPSNVIGQLHQTRWVAAWGPVKGIPSNGIGYVVPLVDPAGRTCRGYVSQTVVQLLRCGDATRFRGFPEPLDGHAGPCVDRD